MDSQEEDSDSSQPLETVELLTEQPPTAEISVDVSQPLETRCESLTLVVSESSNGFKNHPHQVMNGSQKLQTEPLTAAALAHRLKVSTTTISRRKSKPDFPQWASSHDPEGISWAYSKQSRLFLAG
jgi:hypothetical protein